MVDNREFFSLGDSFLFSDGGEEFASVGDVGAVLFLVNRDGSESMELFRVTAPKEQDRFSKLNNTLLMNFFFFLLFG